MEGQVKTENRFMSRGWRTLWSVLTFIAIAMIGQALITVEPFRTLWVPASAFVALLIWYLVGRYVVNRNSIRE